MGSTQFLFGRQWSVTLGIAGSLVQVAASGSAAATQAVSGQTLGYQYDSLRVTFDIDKTSASSSNKAKIEIYNLAAKSRSQFQKGTQIWVQAGYQGLMNTLYVGDALPNGVRSRRDGPDIITSFECGCFEKNLTYSHFDKSYPQGSTYLQVFKDLAASLGASVGVVIGIQNQVFQSGVSFSGTVKQTLDTLCKTQGLEWHVDNNTLNIIPISAHLGDTAIVVSNDPEQPTGLIGVPSQGDGFTEFTSLLNPHIVPASLCQLISKSSDPTADSSLNGFYKVRRAHYEGDSHGDKWQVSCEGVRINAAQTFPQSFAG